MSNITKPPAGRQLIANHHLAPDLGCWMFNEGAGMQVYDYAENKHGAFSNINPSIAWVGSPYGPALDFDGTNDYIAIPTRASNNIPFSIAFIISFDTLTAGEGILAIQSVLNEAIPSLLFQQQANSVRLYLADAYSSNYSVNTKQWYNMVITFKNPSYGTATLFVDGIKTVSVNGGNQTDNTLYLGNGFSGYFDGQLVSCMLYSRVLSDDEIKKLYNEPFCMFQSPRFFSVGLSLVSRDLQALWDARQLALRDLQALWDARQLANRDLQAPWDARQLATQDLQSLWDARQLATQDLQSLWDARQLALRDLQAIFDVLTSAARDLQALWDTRQVANRDLQAPWDTRQLAARDLQAIWDVLGALVTVFRDLQAIWDARQLAARDLQSLWDARQVTSRDLQAIFDVLTKATRDLQALWDARQVATQDLQSLWDTRQVTSRDLQALWDVLGALEEALKIFLAQNRTYLFPAQDRTYLFPAQDRV